jgi:hypothetical protein
MRTLLSASASCLLLAGAVAPAAAAPPAAADEPSAGITVTIHHVAPVLLYRLLERFPSGDQLDEGTLKFTYTCDPGDTGDTSVNALAGTDRFSPSTFGEAIPCDGKRHTGQVVVSRESAEPFAPPRFEDTFVSIFVIAGPGEPEVGERLTEPVRVRYLGF